MTDKFRIPTAEEKDIIRRNHIDPEGVAVISRSDDSMVLLVHSTRDTIHLHAGDRKWQ